MLIENLTEASIELFVYGRGYSPSSQIYDQLGNQYGEPEVSLGRERNIQEPVHPGIPLAARLTFQNLPDNLKVVSLSLGVQAGRGYQVLLFRSVPLVR